MNKIFAMIPARIGSVRLKKKNLALINKKPLIEYAIDAALQSKIFNKIFINSDDSVFKKISKKKNIEFYKRNKKLGSSSTKSDDVVYDFIKNNPCDIIFWVNSISPLQTGSEIKKIFEYFTKNKFDTIHTVKKDMCHVIFNKHPLNYDEAKKFSKTQDLKPIFRFVYSLMGWNVKEFIKNYETNGIGFFSGKVGYYEVDLASSINIKNKNDLILCDKIFKGSKKVNTLEYSELAYDRK